MNSTKLLLVILITILSCLLLVSCKWQQPPEKFVASLPPANVEVEPIVQEAAVVVTLPTTCQSNTQCGQGLYCIDASCARLSELNNNKNCKQTCELTKAHFITSDGEKYALTKGQGTYTAAGALEWKVMAFGPYCQGVEPKIPVLLIKKNAGKILEESVITIQEGNTSNIITHPTVKRVKFTVTLAAVEEVCK